MKIAKKRLGLQRRALDARLAHLAVRSPQPAPRSGWLKAVREALGLTTRRLAARLGTTPPVITRMEQRETKGTVTLQSLERAARAMNCRLVYAIVPEDPRSSLDDIVSAQALAFARQLAGKVGHSMRLEDQAVGDEGMEAQVKSLAEELKEHLDSRIWSPTT